MSLDPLLVRRLYRRLRIRLFGPATIAGHCRKCGECCKELVLCTDERWMTRKKDFEAFKVENPEYERLEIIGRDVRGLLIFRCTWLTEEGLCKDHEHRMDLCRDHPSETFYECGAELSPFCGYKVLPPIPSWLRERRNKRSGTPGPTFQTVLDRAKEAASDTDGQTTDDTESA